MLEIVSFSQSLFSSSSSLFFIKTVAFFVKFIIFSSVVKNLIFTKTAQKLWMLIGVTIFSMLVIDANWIIRLLQTTFFPAVSFTLIKTFTQLGAPFAIVQYLCFILFLDYLIHKRVNINLHIYYLISLGCLSAMATLMGYNAIFGDATSYIATTTICLQIAAIYDIFIVIPAIGTIIYRIHRSQLPKILNHQLRILVNYLIVPHLVLEAITTNPFAVTNAGFRTNYGLIALSTLQLTYAVYYCAKKMIQLRFLNNKKQVISKNSFNFIKDFKEVLDQLSHVVNTNELSHITQNFFKSAFGIAFNKIKLSLRTLDKTDTQSSFLESADTLHIYIEDFLSKHMTPEFKGYLYNAKILIKDEIEFTNFYDENKLQSLLLEFLNALNAAVFLPLYEKQTLIGYIIIEHDARKYLFTNVDQDEMIVFAGYLANTINIVRTSNVNQLIKTNKDLTEDLYNKHQEIQQYKESIRSFLKNSQERKIGILFYKNRKFSYGNQVAQELLPININEEEGTPLAQSLKKLSRTVLEYKTPQSLSTKDPAGNRLMISAIPSLEENYIILTVYYPEISDIIKLQRDLLKDPSNLDYLLYLETTKSGQLIHQLIPGNGETLLNFKITLLHMALSKKATVLDMAQEDLMPTVELLHTISLRTKLHIITLTQPEKNYETAFKLFGANPLFGAEYQEPLLETLNNVGTLFIENIDFLSLETQEYLAEFLTYGFFHVFKSDKKVISNVRILCSTKKPLQETNLSKNLLRVLEKMILTLPPLVNLPHTELNELADRFVEQIVPVQAINTMLFLNDKEKEQLINQNPFSIAEFKELIQKRVQAKSAKPEVLHEQTTFHGALSDPAITRAIRLGKKALKDPEVMQLLWNTLQNESKIATLLGVNRSSVNRRYKEYHTASQSIKNTNE